MWDKALFVQEKDIANQPKVELSKVIATVLLSELLDKQWSKTIK